MLTKNQENYLRTIPEQKIIEVKPFNPKAKEVGDSIVWSIKNKLPNMEVLFMSATALGIAGQNDIDLNVLSKPSEYNKYLSLLMELFGEPSQSNPNLVKWEFIKDGFEVELYLTDRDSPLLQEQIRTFNILKNNSELTKKYERIKMECNGLPFREYMRRKYEFFNEVLEINDKN